MKAFFAHFMIKEFIEKNCFSNSPLMGNLQFNYFKIMQKNYNDQLNVCYTDNTTESLCVEGK